MSSMRQVAAHAGTSVSTVSHVIHGTRYVSPEMTRRVLDAMTTLRFPIDRKSVPRKPLRKQIFGLIISDIANPFFSEVAQGFEHAALRHGCECTIAQTGYQEERLLHAGQRLLKNGVAGVAVMTSEINPDLVRSLGRRHLPTVLLDEGPLDATFSRVGIDYEAGIEAALLHLHELGHRAIGFISGPSHYRSIRQRRRAFEQVARALKMTPQISEATLESRGSEEAVQRLMRQTPRPTALLTCNDLMAMGALQALASMGLRVPQDMSVVGFDNIGLTTVMQPPLTTIEAAPRKLGIIALEALRQLRRKEGSPPAHGTEYRFPCRLVVRQSTAAVSRKF